MYPCAPCDVYEGERPPDPDPEQQSNPLNERLIGHAHRDISCAIEKGTFAVETSRVHAPKDTFEHIDWAWKRDTQQHGTWYNGAAAMSVGPPYLTIELGWEPESGQLLDDLSDHARFEGPCILHGEMHLWRMEDPLAHEVKYDFNNTWTLPDLEQPSAEATADFEWRSVKEVGWR